MSRYLQEDGYKEHRLGEELGKELPLELTNVFNRANVKRLSRTTLEKLYSSDYSSDGFKRVISRQLKKPRDSGKRFTPRKYRVDFDAKEM